MDQSLFLDTSTDQGFLVLSQGGRRLSRIFAAGSHSSHTLLPTIQTALRDWNVSLDEMKLFVYGIGPGSYTGIRVTYMVMQTFAYRWKRPVLGMSSLQLWIPEEPCSCHIPILDARSGGFYAGLAERNDESWTWKEPPRRCDLQTIQEWAGSNGEVPLVSPHGNSLRLKLPPQLQVLDALPSAQWITSESLIEKANLRYDPPPSKPATSSGSLELQIREPLSQHFPGAIFCTGE